MSLPEPNGIERVADYRMDLTRLVYMLYQDHEQQIARCDMKANLILSANSILLAVTASLATRFIQGNATHHGLVLVATLLVPMLLASGFAIQSALSIAYPRLWVVPKDREDSSDSELFFSAQIAALSPEQYLHKFLAAGLDDIKRHVLLNVHAKARVLTAKYRQVRRGISATLVAFVFWVLLIFSTSC